jgi:hypothetical protein
MFTFYIARRDICGSGQLQFSVFASWRRPACSFSAWVVTDDHPPPHPGRRLRRVLRLAGGTDREPPGAVGEVDAFGGRRATFVLLCEFWAGMLDRKPR